MRQLLSHALQIRIVKRDLSLKLFRMRFSLPWCIRRSNRGRKQRCVKLLSIALLRIIRSLTLALIFSTIELTKSSGSSDTTESCVRYFNIIAFLHDIPPEC